MFALLKTCRKTIQLLTYKAILKCDDNLSSGEATYSVDEEVLPEAESSGAGSSKATKDISQRILSIKFNKTG